MTPRSRRTAEYRLQATIPSPAGPPLEGLEQIQRHAEDAADLMKALGNKSRLLILCSLVNQERSVGELNEIIPLSQSALSQQLARLRQQGLVQTRRQSQTIFYSLNPGPVHQVIRLLHEIYCEEEGPPATES